MSQKGVVGISSFGSHLFKSTSTSSRRTLASAAAGERAAKADARARKERSRKRKRRTKRENGWRLLQHVEEQGKPIKVQGLDTKSQVLHYFSANDAEEMHVRKVPGKKIVKHCVSELTIVDTTDGCKYCNGNGDIVFVLVPRENVYKALGQKTLERETAALLHVQAGHKVGAKGERAEGREGGGACWKERLFNSMPTTYNRPKREVQTRRAPTTLVYTART